LPREGVEAIREFAAGGKGLPVMDAHDCGGSYWSFVNRKSSKESVLMLLFR